MALEGCCACSKSPSRVRDWNGGVAWSNRRDVSLKRYFNYQASPIFDCLRPPWSWLLYVAVIRRQKEITRSCQGIFDRIIIELLVADTTFSLYLDVTFLWGKWHRLVTMTMLVYSLFSFPQDFFLKHPCLMGGIQGLLNVSCTWVIQPWWLASRPGQFFDE